jgi:hypothetical protein
LRGPIPAGTWRLIADGIILDSVDVRFSILLRPGDGPGQTELAAFTQHFDPLDGGEYRAQAYEETAELDAVDAAAGDQLVLRYTGTSSSAQMAYIPNGDGETTGGRIPYIELPH